MSARFITMSLHMGMTLLLCCCIWAAARAGDCGAIPAGAKIDEVGAFSNMRYTDEHAYGYTVKLWRAGDCIFGLFESSEGLAGDTPMGELQGVKYDRKTGALTFSAKLTMGVVSLGGSKGFEPSRDLFSFAGELRATGLTGGVTHGIQNTPNAPPIYNKVTLLPSKEEAEFMHGSGTYGEWRERWQPVLRFRGPKW